MVSILNCLVRRMLGLFREAHGLFNNMLYKRSILSPSAPHVAKTNLEMIRVQEEIDLRAMIKTWFALLQALVV